MTERRGLNLSLVQYYLTILAFKTVARATSMVMAVQLWDKFKEAIHIILEEEPVGKRDKVISYFNDEWYVLRCFFE